jgi:hypothetical protein
MRRVSEESSPVGKANLILHLFRGTISDLKEAQIFSF